MKYDYLIVGAGLYGAVFARQMTDNGKKCLVIDKRSHVGGNIYSDRIEGIEVHMYGPHIFHTDNEQVWSYVNRFAKFNHFIYSPIANYKGEIYNLPFNMNTFVKMWSDVNTPEQARQRIKEQVKKSGVMNPKNLEEQAISLVGTDIYEKLICGYTEKQWGRPCKDLPPFIIKRIPVRFVYDNNYFNHRYQGIPVNGYTEMIQEMLSGIEVRLNTDFLKNRASLQETADKVVYTGPIDEYYDYCYGELEYRSLRFEIEILDTDNYQGVAGMNFTDTEHSYTRIIEHKHFMFGEGNKNKTVITREYPTIWKKGDEPYYPINDSCNNEKYERYLNLAKKDRNMIFGGRLGTYRYMDMDQIIKQALDDSK